MTDTAVSLALNIPFAGRNCVTWSTEYLPWLSYTTTTFAGKYVIERSRSRVTFQKLYVTLGMGLNPLDARTISSPPNP